MFVVTKQIVVNKLLLHFTNNKWLNNGIEEWFVFVVNEYVELMTLMLAEHFFFIFLFKIRPVQNK